MSDIKDLNSLISVLKGIDIDAIKNSLYMQYNLTQEQIDEVEDVLKNDLDNFKSDKKEVLERVVDTVNKK
jgi:ferritin-like metal-binding protein YciE